MSPLRQHFFFFELSLSNTLACPAFQTTIIDITWG
jgi:hypothetical protein